MGKKILKFFIGSMFLTILLMILFPTVIASISYFYNYCTKESFKNYNFTTLPIDNFDKDIKVDIIAYSNWGDYRYTLKINDSLKSKSLYGFIIKEKQTQKTAYAIGKIDSDTSLIFSNLYLENKTYLLEIKFYYKDNPNKIFSYNYEILPRG